MKGGTQTIMLKNKIIALIMAIVTIFTFVSCEEYNFSAITPGGNMNKGDGDSSESNKPTLNDDPTDDFTVTLMLDGKNYSPRIEMSVYWDDGFSRHAALVDQNGIARVDGLDGDYRVTLSTVPNEYAYNPNAYVATNDNKDITIELFHMNLLSGGGTGMYDCYSFRKTGVYSAVIEDPTDAIWFEYAPETNGVYTIESWIDVTADNVNPYIEVYDGSTQYKYKVGITSDGGAVGSYTTNFVHEVRIYDDNISSAGQAVYTFAVKAESKNDKYPITVVFAVTRDRTLDRVHDSSSEKSIAIPEYDFSNFDKSAHEYGSSYKFVNPEYKLSGTTNTYVFDASKYKLWQKKDGGDDFYHVYDEEKYASTGGYGPIVYAYITSSFRFLDTSFHKVEYRNGQMVNSALTVYGKNYKHFIEGYSALALKDDDVSGKFGGGSYYCAETCTCHDVSESKEKWMCKEGCENCLPSCRQCPEELMEFEGYQYYANSDGVVPVTEELKEFLNGYAGQAMFFLDGMGHLDGGSSNALYGGRFECEGDAAWLWACGYYVES